jgi:nicotinamidase/pyrazinamidase
MKFPDFYAPSKVGTLYVPRVQEAVSAGLSSDIPHAVEDKQRTLLLLVDMQVDFIHTDGALSVPGAVDDTRRTIEWMFTNITHITTIAASLDSHLPVQIFYGAWWVDSHGNNPQPYTEITAEDVESGRWQPLFDPAWSHEYVQRLQSQAKKNLMIWPYHTMIGTPGHNLTPALYEAVAYHAAARQTEPIFLSKGSIPKTEHYSMLEPEVKVPDQPQGTLNTDFLDMIAGYDEVYIVGQAKSHCVLETVQSMMTYFSDSKEIIGKMHVLFDAMSSVAHPEIDFEGIANEAFDRFARQGLSIMTTDTTSLAE